MLSANLAHLALDLTAARLTIVWVVSWAAGGACAEVMHSLRAGYLLPGRGVRAEAVNAAALVVEDDGPRAEQSITLQGRNPSLPSPPLAPAQGAIEASLPPSAPFPPSPAVPPSPVVPPRPGPCLPWGPPSPSYEYQ